MSDEPNDGTQQESRHELKQIQSFIGHYRERIKPLFGLMFWQLQELESSMSAEQFAREGLNLSFDDEEDEVFASFMANYIKVWRSANDFNAASRFIASSLGMSADELLQSRQVFISQGKIKE